MKKLFLLVFTIMGIITISYAQPCLPDGIVFNTQAQIDNFSINYPDCTEIEGDVQVEGVNITNLNGLSVLTSNGGNLTIVFNDALTSLTGLDNLTSIGGNLGIALNDALTSLTGLDNLTSIGGWLDISNNDALASLTILDNLTSIGGDLYIGYNASLLSLTGLDNVPSIGGDLTISSNDVLTSLTGLDNVPSIGGNLNIGLNDVLTSLTGLDNVTSIGGGIEIYNNDALISLTGLENVTSIGELLYIGSNDVLASLTGLDNIEAGSINGLFIQENILLVTCEVESVCNYLISQNGETEIQDNATGCNSQEEVELACGVSINENRQSISLNISPNPFTTSTTIEYTLLQPETVTITFYNQFGKQVDVIEQKQAGTQHVVWSPDLPGGVYYFRLKAGEQVATGKVMLVK